MEAPHTGDLTSTEIQVLLAEYQQRHESYRSYRRDYLTFLTLGFFSVAAIDTIVVRESANLDEPTITIMVMLTLTMQLCVVAAHFIGIRVVRRLGHRLDSIEARLGIEPFHTTRPLLMALYTTTIAVTGMMICHILYALLVCLDVF